MRSAVTIVASIGAMAFASSALPADAPDSASFIKEAMQGNLGEVAVGHLAEQKGQSKGVKSFGAMLAKDHSAANTKAMQAASALGVTPPTEPGPEQKKVSDELSALQGSAFDAHFAEIMVGDHEKDIAKYEKEAKASDAVGKYAKETLPTLQKHLERAKALRGPKTGRAAS